MAPVAFDPLDAVVSPRKETSPAMTWRFYTHGTDELAMTPASASP
jgi:hypothetical protein